MESDGKLRLLRLLEILQTESDEQHPISIAEITEMMKERWGLDAYRITVQRILRRCGRRDMRSKPFAPRKTAIT